MKIYRFQPETGFYLGEDFTDEAPMRRGAFVIPPDATTTAPPEVGRGLVQVFDAATKQWVVRQTDNRR